MIDTQKNQLSEGFCETRRRHSDGASVVLSEGRGPTLQSSRSLDALSDLKLQRLEAELEGARHQAEGACQREKELRAELQRLQQEVAQLHDAQSQVKLTSTRALKHAFVRLQLSTRVCVSHRSCLLTVSTAMWSGSRKQETNSEFHLGEGKLLISGYNYCPTCTLLAVHKHPLCVVG